MRMLLSKCKPSPGQPQEDQIGWRQGALSEAMSETDVSHYASGCHGIPDNPEDEVFMHLQVQ